MSLINATPSRITQFPSQPIGGIPDTIILQNGQRIHIAATEFAQEIGVGQVPTFTLKGMVKSNPLLVTRDKSGAQSLGDMLNGVDRNAPNPLEEIAKCKKRLMVAYAVIRKALEPEGVKVGFCGGAIRDLFGFNCYMPKDFDIFLLADPKKITQEKISEILQDKSIIRFQPLDAKSAQKPTSLYAHMSLKSESYSSDIMPFIDKVYFAHENFGGLLPIGHEVPMQFMYRDINKISDFFQLINAFDWNLCRFGIFDGQLFKLNTEMGRLVVNPDRLGDGKDEYGAEIVLRRGMNFSMRYDIPIDAESLFLCCEAVAKQVKNNEAQIRQSQILGGGGIFGGLLGGVAYQPMNNVLLDPSALTNIQF